jgi:hypothetical protein
MKKFTLMLEKTWLLWIFYKKIVCSVKWSLVDSFSVQKMCLYISQLLTIHEYAIYLKNALLICWGVVGGGEGVYMGYGLNGYILIPWLWRGLGGLERSNILLYGAKIQVEIAFKFKGLENACKESPMKMKKVNNN